MRKFVRALSLVFILCVAIFGIASGNYTGPSRTYAYVVNHDCEYTARLYYRGSGLNYYCTLRLTEGSCNPGNKASYFNTTSCVGWPASCTSANYSCNIWVSSDTPNYAYGSYDPATASASFACTTWGANGWCRSGPRFNFSGNEPLSGYVIRQFEGNFDNSNNAAIVCDAPDAASTSCSYTNAGAIPQTSGTLYYWAVSSYGDTSSKNSLGFKYDATNPGVSLNVTAGTAGNNGWYRSNVTVQGSASDGQSGLASLSLSCGSNPCTITAEGTTTVNATATDNAGNQATTSLTVKKDTVAPNISHSLSGTAGSNGWYTSDVQVSASASDATSGLASLSLSCGSNPCTVTSEGTTTITTTATDNAGNQATQTVTVKKDTVAPNITLSPSGTTGNNGWYRSAVTLSASASDATSGLASLSLSCGTSPCTINTEGSTPVSATATDNAGNQASQNTTIRIDTTPPTVSLNAPSPDGQNGWYTSSVTVSVSGTDQTSGVAAQRIRISGGSWQSNSLTLTGDGTFIIEGQTEDTAGNTSGTAQITVKRDATPPTADLTISGTQGSNGWYTSTVQLTPQGSDATSGLASLRINTGSGWQTGVQSLADGVYTVQVQAVDQAGNTTTITCQVQVDTTPPSLAPQIASPDGQNGWYVSTVSLDAVATDATSGLNALRAQVNGGTWQSLPITLDQDGTYTVTFEAVDQAGNTNRQTRTLYVDITPPTITTQIPSPDGLDNWFVSEPQIDTSASDATSGMSAFYVSVDNGAWQAPPVTLPEGVHTVVFQAVDQAGNVSTSSTTIYVDTTAPSGQAILSGIPGNDDWWRSPVQVSLQADDQTSGVVRAEISADGGQTWQDSLTLPEGIHDLQIVIQDKAGWQTSFQTRVLVDLTSPTATIDTGNNDKVSKTVTLSGTLDDATSGVASAEISVDGGQTWKAVLPVSGQFIPVTAGAPLSWSFDWDTTRNPGGNNTVILRVTDRAGNTYQTEKTFFVANALPAVGFAPDRWYIWESGGLRVAEGDLPVIRVCLRVEDPQDRWPAWEQCWNNPNAVPDTFVWDRRFADGTLAPVGEYRVVLSATDLILRTVQAVGTIVIPLAPTPTPTSTPTNTPTPTPTATGTLTTAPSSTPTAWLPAPTRVAPTPTLQATPAPRARVIVRPVRSFWQFLTLVGLALALGLSAVQDRRPQAVKKLAKTLRNLMEVKRD